MGELTVFHLNINGLRARRTELEVTLKECDPDIVCLNETKLNGKAPPTLCGYRLAAMRDRSGERVAGGGVAIYARRQFATRDISPDFDDLVVVSLECNGVKYAIASYYCAPNRALDTINLRNIIIEYPLAIIVGDLNAKHRFFGSTETNRKGDTLFDFTEEHDLTVVNDPDQPTRHDVHTGSADILDYCIVTKGLLNKVTACVVGDDVGSDHFPLILRLRVGGRPVSVPVTLTRPLSKCDWKVFESTLLRDCDSLAASIERTEAAIDSRVSDFERSVSAALDVACPLRETKMYSFRVSRETLDLIRSKRRLRRQVQRNPVYRTAYNQISRRVSEAVTREKRGAWETATAELNNLSGAQFWKVFKRLTSTGKSQTSTCPRLRVDGTFVSDPVAVCDTFARHLELVHSPMEGGEFSATHWDRVTHFTATHRDVLTPLFDDTRREGGQLDDSLRATSEASEPIGDYSSDCTDTSSSSSRSSNNMYKSNSSIYSYSNTYSSCCSIDSIDEVNSDSNAGGDSVSADSPTDDPVWLTEDIDVSELQNALKLCKSSGAPGPDGIAFSILKRIPERVLVALTKLYNTCLHTGYFPRRWKEANGIMIAKPGKDHTVAANYRPISLLNTLGKLFERIVARRLTEHFQESNFFNGWQRAYLQKKEASEIVYRLAEEIKASARARWSTTAISLDVEKAFDSVWHDGLRYKLHSVGLPDGVCRLLSSYIQDRTIRVRFGSHMSEAVPLKAGTPQGSVLSPLLYLIYVNDLPLGQVRKVRAGQFADDVDIWTSERSTLYSYRRLQESLDKISAWCAKWRVKLNVGKTQLTTFGLQRWRKPRAHRLRNPNYRGRGRKKCNIYNLYLSGRQLNPKTKFTILGVTMDSWHSRQGLRLGTHVREAAAKAGRRTHLLRMVSGQGWGANQRTVLRLYKQYVRPVLEHGYVVTAGTREVKVLELVERRALRIALRRPRYSRIEDLYRDAGFQPLAERLEVLKGNAIRRFGQNPRMRELEDLMPSIITYNN